MGRRESEVLRRRRLAAGFLCLAVGFAGPVLAQGLGVSAVQAVILGVWPGDEDGIGADGLRIQVAKSVDNDPAWLEVRDAAGILIASEAIDADDVDFVFHLADIMHGFPTPAYGWSYEILVRSQSPSADLLAEPFPFHMLGCPGQYHFIPGLQTDAVVVTEELDQALEEHNGYLWELAAVRPELACQIDQLDAQLDAQGSAFGQCAWYVVVEGDHLMKQRVIHDRGSRVKGVEAGPSHCYSVVANGMVDDVGDGGPAEDSEPAQCVPDLNMSTAHQLQVKIRCRDAVGRFGTTQEAGCDGQLDVAAELRAISKAHVHSAAESTLACSTERLELSTSGGEAKTILEARSIETGEQFSAEGNAQDVRSTFAASAGEPLSLSLRATGGAKVVSPLGVETFTEFGNVYRYQITARSQCMPVRHVALRSPSFMAVLENGFVTVEPMADATLTNAFISKATGGLKDTDW